MYAQTGPIGTKGNALQNAHPNVVPMKNLLTCTALVTIDIAVTRVLDAIAALEWNQAAFAKKAMSAMAIISAFQSIQSAKSSVKILMKFSKCVHVTNIVICQRNFVSATKSDLDVPAWTGMSDILPANAVIPLVVLSLSRPVVGTVPLIKSSNRSEEAVAKTLNAFKMGAKMARDQFGRYHAMANHLRLNWAKNVNYQIHSAVQAATVVVDLVHRKVLYPLI